MESGISSIIAKTSDLQGKLSDLVTGYEYPTDNKSKILLAYHSIIAEHHSAIFLLVKNDLHGSAFALVRALYEPLYRAYWIVGCANEAQVDKILEGKDIFPKMYEMVKEIDDSFGIDGFFQNIKKNSWGPMNDYTHSGLLQIGRRFKDDQIVPNYETDAVIEVLDGINIALMLMALLFFKVFSKEEAVKKVEQMLTEYSSGKNQTENA